MKIGFSVIALCLTAQAYTPPRPPMRGGSGGRDGVLTNSNNNQGRFFLDSADWKDWQDLLPSGIFHGVSVNPISLEEAKEPCTIENLQSMAVRALAGGVGTPSTRRSPDIYDDDRVDNVGAANPWLDEFDCPEFHCQAWGTTVEELYSCGMALSEPDPDRIVVKVPATREGIQAASKLIRNGQCRVGLIACYDVKQAMIAANIGAEYLEPHHRGTRSNSMMNTGFAGSGGSAGASGVAKDVVTQCLEMQQIASLGMKSDLRILAGPSSGVQTVPDMVDLAMSARMNTFALSPEMTKELLNDPFARDNAQFMDDTARRNSQGSSPMGDRRRRLDDDDEIDRTRDQDRYGRDSSSSRFENSMDRPERGDGMDRNGSGNYNRDSFGFGSHQDRYAGGRARVNNDTNNNNNNNIRNPIDESPSSPSTNNKPPTGYDELYGGRVPPSDYTTNSNNGSSRSSDGRSSSSFYSMNGDNVNENNNGGSRRGPGLNGNSNGLNGNSNGLNGNSNGGRFGRGGGDDIDDNRSDYAKRFGSDPTGNGPSGGGAWWDQSGR